MRRMDNVVRLVHRAAKKEGLRIYDARLELGVYDAGRPEGAKPRPYRFKANICNEDQGNRAVTARGVDLGYPDLAIDVQYHSRDGDFRVSFAPRCLGGGERDQSFVEDWHVSEDELATAIRRGFRKARRWMKPGKKQGRAGA